MRIIAGKYKGYKLFTLEGVTTRPTTDFIKEAMFSIVGDFEDLAVLDLYSGSGALGLEALSRGAEHVSLVEGSAKAVHIILQNMEKLKCQDTCHVHQKKVSVFLHTNVKKFDLIIMDPPYNKNQVNPTLKQIVEKQCLNEGGIVVVEHSAQEKIAEELAPFIIKEKKYHDIVLTLLQFQENKDENLQYTDED